MNPIVIVMLSGISIFAVGVLWGLYIARIKGGEGFENHGEFQAAVIVMCIGIVVVVIDILWFIFNHLKILWE